MPDSTKVLPPKIVIHDTAESVAFMPRGVNNPKPIVYTSK